MISQPNKLYGLGVDLGRPGGDRTALVLMGWEGVVFCVDYAAPSDRPGALVRLNAAARLYARGLRVSWRRRGCVA